MIGRQTATDQPGATQDSRRIRFARISRSGSRFHS